MKKRAVCLLILVFVFGAGLVGYRPMNTRLPDQTGHLEERNPLFEAALSYLDRRPGYRSAYYAGSGYPTDGWGTCVDVIGMALRECGYDLRTRVNEDIRTHPECYEIETPDIDIDFRRVKNLKTYFCRNEEVLSADLCNPDDWKAGDIVIFENHIAMVSDRRNGQGIPFIVHHRSFFQLRYEEDWLSTHTPEVRIRIRRDHLRP